MLEVESCRHHSQTDSDLINQCIGEVAQNGGIVKLASREYLIGKPICIKSGVTLLGEGPFATHLRGTKDLVGPILISEKAEELIEHDAWFEDEGVPVRFKISNLMLNGEDCNIGNSLGSGCGLFLYGKGFEVSDIQICHMPLHGIVSLGSARGGQRSWLDEPEAVFDVRISNCGGDGFLMRGPHDSIIRQAIIAKCKGRGLAVEREGKYNGACDIHYCHAYGTDKTAIDLAAKVKAGFLQADTGRDAGIKISKSDRTFISQIECFKTRGTIEDFALDITTGAFAQIGMARVRADWGTSGVKIASTGVQINQLDVDGLRNSGGPVNQTPNDGVGLLINTDFVNIGYTNIRNFSNGSGLVLKPGLSGSRITATVLGCKTPWIAEGVKGCSLDLDFMSGLPTPQDVYPPEIPTRLKFREFPNK